MAKSSRLVGMALVAFVVTYAMAKYLKREPVDAPESTQPSEQRASDAGKRPSADAPPGMVWIPGGDFMMGTNDVKAWPDEKPAHLVHVDGFWMDKTEVTNAQFRKFVVATGYVTTAERKPDWDEMKKQLSLGTPKPAPDKLVPGSLVFHLTAGPVRLRGFLNGGRGRPARTGGIRKVRIAI